MSSMVTIGIFRSMYRYESGRNLPKPVQLLFHLAYAPEKQSLAMLRLLRRVKESNQK